MEGEVLRDSLLHLAGVLDLTTGGPELPLDLGETSGRRSIYYRYSRDDKLELLNIFDAASVDECYRRNESIVPQQALALVNSQFSWSQARSLTRRLLARLDSSSRHTSTPQFVAAAFEDILCRPPTREELVQCQRFLDDQAALFRHAEQLTLSAAGPPSAGLHPDDADLQAKEYLVHVLLNHNDFVTIR
jgi:hypothetical protein